MLLLQTTNPLDPIYKYGPGVGSAIISTGLFIWAQIQIFQFKKTVEAHTETILVRNEELKAALSSQVEAQRKLAESVHGLADAIHHQSDMHAEQLSLIREMISEQKVMAANQMTIMNGFQRVVEQLIDIVKE